MTLGRTDDHFSSLGGRFPSGVVAWAMRPCSFAVGVMVSVVSVVVAATGCTTTAGTPVADTDGRPETSQATTSVEVPSGETVGTAVMKVTGGTAPVTIRYRINGGPEQTEAGVTLPWEKQYPVFNEVESEVAADGGDTVLTCTIMMDGDMLVSFKTEPRPVCNFAYWG